MHIPIIALFVADFIQGLANTISMKWVIEGEVNAGMSCTAQGALLQMGVAGVALATLAIAVLTFVAMWWLRNPTIVIASGFIGVQWIFIALFVGIEFGVHTHPPSAYYATPTPYWCWINQNFKAQRIAGEYFWLWLTLFVSIALYLPLCLLHLKIIKPGERWYQPTMESNKRKRGPSRGLRTAWVYPPVYCLVVLPQSIIRWISFKQEATYGKARISPVVILIFANLFALGGFLNAVTYLLTRSSLFFPENGDKSNTFVTTDTPESSTATAGD
jgi:hypothetical protein